MAGPLHRRRERQSPERERQERDGHGTAPISHADHAEDADEAPAPASS